MELAPFGSERDLTECLTKQEPSQASLSLGLEKTCNEFTLIQRWRGAISPLPRGRGGQPVPNRISCPPRSHRQRPGRADLGALQADAVGSVADAADSGLKI